jgi:hypothetical protein
MSGNRALVPAIGIGAQPALVFGAEKPPDRRAQAAGQDIPAGLLHGGDAGGAVMVAGLDQLKPDGLRLGGVLADDQRAQLLDVAHVGLGGQPAGALAQPDQPLIGIELDKDPVLPRVAHHYRLQIGYSHSCSVYDTFLTGLAGFTGLEIMY